MLVSKPRPCRRNTGNQRAPAPQAVQQQRGLHRDALHPLHSRTESGGPQLPAVVRLGELVLAALINLVACIPREWLHSHSARNPYLAAAL